ncbi:MAG TPA: hypothetical protein VM536_10505 [Chloroflexia bacterium]|nr:hypothetical protein [Chloroflexia bacterium]
MNTPIPFPQRPDQTDPDDEATEVTLDTNAAVPRVTTRLPAETDLASSLAEILLAPLATLPPETRAHLRTAGREVTLTFASLGGTLLKGAAIALNVAAETLKDYSARHANVTDLDAARTRRQRVEIEVE